MKTDVLTASSDMSTFEAAIIMAKRGAGSIVVVRGSRPIGIFTERDLIQKVIVTGINPESVPIGDYMTRRIVTLRSDNTVEEAYGRMREGNFRHILVTERGTLTGILSVKDLTRVRERVLERVIDEKTSEIRLVRDQLAKSLEQLNREMEYAGVFQKQLVARPHPRVPGIKFSHIYEQTSSIGGDFFEVSRLDQDSLGIFVADVMGHGITSAMIAIEVKLNFDQLSRNHNGPSYLVSDMNDALIPLMPDGYFVAGFYAIVNLRTLVVEYTQFGLPRPVLLRAGSMRLDSFPTTNLPIGIRKTAVYKSAKMKIRPGDKLLLFTDGCVEQKNHSKKILGEKKFLTYFKELAGAGDGAITKKLYKYVQAYADGIPIADDIAILLCEFSSKYNLHSVSKNGG